MINTSTIESRPSTPQATSIFEKRVAFKPFEYPEVVKYAESIQHSYWLVSEWNFISDIDDFHVKLNDIQKSAIKNTLLAISQIEVSVKKFWSKIGDRYPKPEIEQVGAVFSECECRHQSAYSHLLEVLNLNNDFNELLKVPEIQGRVDYLSKYLKDANSKNDQDYLLTLTLFSIFIENISLFSQFCTIKSFNKHLNLLKSIDNVVSSTLREECIHALFGVFIVNKVKEEKPEWFDDKFYEKIYKASRKAYKAEAAIIDWIFEKGELDFLPKDTLKEYIKDRFNESIRMIDGKDIFDIDKSKLKQLQWFNDEINGEVIVDFFHKKSSHYSKRINSITETDLF